MKTALFVLVSTCVACSACGSNGNSAPNPTDAGGDAQIATTATLAIDGDPNGLFWEDATATLWIADDGNNRVLTFRDGEGITKYADLPAAPANGPGLGQLVRLKDGSIVVTRFGFGTTGDVVLVNPDRTSAKIPGLDPAKRRIGLTVTADGKLFDGYFLKTGSGQIGSVAELSLNGTEKDVVSGLQKTIGVLAVGDELYVSDQTQGKLFATPITSPGTLTTVGDLPSADLLCSGPDGAIFSGGSDGSVRAVDASGATKVVVTGLAQARGVAFDAKHRRIFVANHTGTPGTNTIEVRPIP
jgi:sugar lactone lactonase YvrE